MSIEEKIQVVDEFTGEPTGEHVPRSEIFSKKLWCRTTNIFILNNEGQILCHKRSAQKERFPGHWSTHFGGHVTEGESFRINAVKEIEEEIGLRVPIFQMIPWRTSRKADQRIWTRDFVTAYDGSIEKLVFQKSEIDEIAWFSPSEIIHHTKNGTPGWDPVLAGFHEFAEDYQALRAAMTVCLDLGVFSGQYNVLHKWAPRDLQRETIM